MTAAAVSPTIRSTAGRAWRRVGEWMADRMDRTRETDHSGRELAGLGAVVVLLGIAFIALLVEPTQASDLISFR